MCYQGRENGPYQTLVEFPLGQEVDFLCFLFSPPLWPRERSIKNSECRKRKNKNEAAIEVKISRTERDRRDNGKNNWRTPKDKLKQKIHSGRRWPGLSWHIHDKHRGGTNHDGLWTKEIQEGTVASVLTLNFHSSSGWRICSWMFSKTNFVTFCHWIGIWTWSWLAQINIFHTFRTWIQNSQAWIKLSNRSL